MSFIDDLRGSTGELRETHISWVLLFERRVFKVKKPVNYGFLDFTSLERRLAACRAEICLNARLAPSVYLGVAPVFRSAAGRHRLGECLDCGAERSGAACASPGATEEVVDFAVVMRRLPDAERADLLLAAGALDIQRLEHLAAVLAEFHAAAPTGPGIDELGNPDAIAANVRENFSTAHRALASVASETEQAEVERRQLDFLAAHRAHLLERVAAHRIRDCHGDLRLEHVYFSAAERPTILDCIEFNERFRFGDVCADVAFLSMDLAWHGQVGYKEHFLAAYARESDDYDLYGLVDFYESYRAYVRAKVSALTYSAPDTPAAERERLERDARRYFLLALACERPPIEKPRLIAVGGAIATGKSTLAVALGRHWALPVVSSDRTRKALARVSPTTSLGAEPWQGAYSEESTERVYAEVLRRAEIVLRSGRSVVVDASFRTRALRTRAKDLARVLGVEFSFLECRAPRELCRQRLEARALAPSISDGRLDLADTFLAGYEQVLEIDGPEHSIIETGGGIESSLATALEALDSGGGTV